MTRPGAENHHVEFCDEGRKALLPEKRPRNQRVWNNTKVLNYARPGSKVALDKHRRIIKISI